MKKHILLGPIVKRDELATFTRQLSTLLSSGLPLVKGLEVIIRQQGHRKFGPYLQQIVNHIRSGKHFSESISYYPKIFDPLYINIVKAGEAGGVLDEVLEQLAGYMERSVRARNKIRSAMVYPLILVTIACSIVALLLIFVVPKFQNIFAQMLNDAPLPLLTQWVLYFSDFIQQNIGLCIGAILLSVGVLKLSRRVTMLHALWDWILLYSPKLGAMSTIIITNRFARTFSILLRSGIPLLQALQMSSNVVNNKIVERAIAHVKHRVKNGEHLAVTLEQQNIFPAIVTSMVDVGEQTGQLPAMLERIANHTDDEIENNVTQLTSLVEPAMIVALALVVGTIVLALFLPIIGIIDKLAM